MGENLPGIADQLDDASQRAARITANTEEAKRQIVLAVGSEDFGAARETAYEIQADLGDIVARSTMTSAALGVPEVANEITSNINTISTVADGLARLGQEVTQRYIDAPRITSDRLAKLATLTNDMQPRIKTAWGSIVVQLRLAKEICTRHRSNTGALVRRAAIGLHRDDTTGVDQLQGEASVLSATTAELEAACDATQTTNENLRPKLLRPTGFNRLFTKLVDAANTTKSVEQGAIGVQTNISVATQHLREAARILQDTHNVLMLQLGGTAVQALTELGEAANLANALTPENDDIATSLQELLAGLGSVADTAVPVATGARDLAEHTRQLHAQTRQQ